MQVVSGMLKGFFQLFVNVRLLAVLNCQYAELDMCVSTFVSSKDNYNYIYEIITYILDE